jgi:hypothetical protein
LANELQPGILDVAKAVAHARTYVQQQGNVERDFFIAKEGDLLMYVVFINLKVSLGQLRHKSSGAVADEKRKADQRRVKLYNIVAGAIARRT